MSASIELPPDLLERAKRAADQRHSSVREVVLEAVRLGFDRQEQEGRNDFRSAADLTPAERAAAWREWVRGMHEITRRLPPGHFVDDSRESIYD